MRIPYAVLALAAAGSAFEAGAAELVALEWSADSRFTKAISVPPGKFVEACGKLPAKAKVQWSFTAGAPMDFNIHFHEGKQVHFPVRKNRVAKASGTLTTKVGQDYCWMWTNPSPGEATLQFELIRMLAGVAVPAR